MILLRDHSDHHQEGRSLIYLESIPGPDAGHSEDVAGQLGGGALGEGGQEDDDDGDHPVVEELRHQETVGHRDLELGLSGRVGPRCPW